MSDYKITKLPKECDPNSIMFSKMDDYFGICPFCRTGDFVRRKLVARQGKGENTPFYKRLFEKEQVWMKFKYRCRKCECEWESPEFPDLSGGNNIPGYHIQFDGVLCEDGFCKVRY